MIGMLLSFVIAMVPLSQAQGPRPGNQLPFEIRAKQSLVMGKGVSSGETYYDVVITKEPADGVLIKLPYTQKGGIFTFDLHHRLSLTPDFADAEVTTIVEVITGGGTSLGVFNIVGMVNAAGKFEESVTKVSTADVDKYLTPLSSKTVSINTVPGPQSLSIVGKSVTVKRGTISTRIDTPGVRIATVSKLKFAEALTGTRLSVN